MSKPCPIPQYLRFPKVNIKDISDTALDSRISKLENILGSGNLEGVDTSVETLTRIYTLETQVTQLLQRISTLENEVARQAETDARHDTYIEENKEVYTNIEQLVDQING